MPQHLQVRGGGSQGCIRMQSKQYEAGGLEVTFQNAFARPPAYHKTGSLDSPSDTPDALLLGSLHRSGRCEPQVADLQSWAQSFPTHKGTPVHRLYLPRKAHAPVGRTTGNTPALDESENRRNQPPLLHGRSPRLRCTRSTAAHWPSRNLLLQNLSYTTDISAHLHHRYTGCHSRSSWNHIKRGHLSDVIHDFFPEVLRFKDLYCRTSAKKFLFEVECRY